ncbi:MAG: class I SAM-dependent methyltransferase [Acidithiobacillales bacterium]
MRGPARVPLSARAAYPLWASTYDEENALTALEQDAVRLLSPDRCGRLLDAACGTGRRLPPGGSDRRAFGVDLVFEMLVSGRRREVRGRLAAADLDALPFAAGTFDTVWCRLALGHLSRLGPAYRQLARVCRPGATLLVTDVHPDAASRGLRRTFAGSDGRTREVEHHVHLAADHLEEAGMAGLTFDERLDLKVGPEQGHFFAAAGTRERDELESGRPVLLALRFRREPA